MDFGFVKKIFYAALFASGKVNESHCVFWTGAREQMNGATAFLDGSAIYGSSEEAAHRLRTFEGGFLRTGTGDLLPVNPECDLSVNNSTKYVRFFSSESAICISV